jgi:hypothetical protein
VGSAIVEARQGARQFSRNRSDDRQRFASIGCPAVAAPRQRSLEASQPSQGGLPRKGLPADDLKGLIAWLKANPDKGLAGTAGVGSPQHVFGVFFEQATDTRFQFVHYRGGAPAMQELVAGRLDFIISDQVTALPQVSTGTVKCEQLNTTAKGTPPTKSAFARCCRYQITIKQKPRGHLRGTCPSRR